MLLNGKQAENGTKCLKSGKGYRVKNLHGEFVSGTWETEGECAIFNFDGPGFLFPCHVKEVIDEPKRAGILEQALMLLPDYKDKSWPDSEDQKWHEKLDDIKCDIQYAKELISHFVIDHKALAECLLKR